MLRIKSITQLHEVLGFGKPTHPLIAVIDVSKLRIGSEWIGVKGTTDFYSITLKDADCGIEYGRNTYDFGEGVLIFTAPDQVLQVSKEQAVNENSGWMLFFHPDLIRNTTLGQYIDNYHFFSYDVHEALHLSDAEQATITECIGFIQSEITQRIDNHSQRVIVSLLELIMNCSNRYYERQFNTRTTQNKDVVTRFEALIREYYKAGKFTEVGIPSIDYFAGQIHLSTSYLSDLLKKETGFAAKDHINNFIVEKAKTMLLSENETISGIAYKLGFNYPHYFARLFKSKTGLTPQEYKRAK